MEEGVASYGVGIETVMYNYWMHWLYSLAVGIVVMVSTLAANVIDGLHVPASTASPQSILISVSQAPTGSPGSPIDRQVSIVSSLGTGRTLTANNSQISAASTTTKAATTPATFFPTASDYPASSTVPCDSDPDHFTCTKDSRRVYSDSYIIVGADPSTFEVLGQWGNYGKDAKNVYWIIEGEEGPEPHQVLGADPRTFQVLSADEMYAKDANNVYWAGYPVLGADSATFSAVVCVTDNCLIDAKDKNHSYSDGQIQQ
jgi:DKNYY family